MEQLLNEVELLKIEYEKFNRGNKSAGTRARKCLQNIKQFSQNIANALGSMDPAKMVGLIQFTRGGGLPTMGELKGTDPLELARETFQKITKEVVHEFVEASYAN